MSPESDDGIHRLVVHGCGPLAWAQQQKSTPEIPPTTGRIDEMVALTSDLAVSLGEVLDRPWGWLPTTPPPAVDIEIHRGDAGTLPLLPSWEELAALQARVITRTLGGGGVLVTPASWRESRKGRQLLQTWSSLGWYWAALEEVLRLRHNNIPRYAVPAGTWLRLEEGTRRATLPNGPEAALALQLTEPLLVRILQSLDSALADRWWQEEHGASGWFVRQRLTQLLSQALRDGAAGLELGAASHKLFAFSSPAAQETFQELATLRLTFNLPRSAANWWQELSKPGFLESPRDRGKRFVPKWDEGETLIVEHPSEALTDRPELSQLHNLLKFNSALDFQSVDPAKFEEADELAADLGSWLDRRLAEDEEKLLAAAQLAAADESTTSQGEIIPSEPVDTDLASIGDTGPSPIGDPLSDDPFDPSICRLDTPHRATSVLIREVAVEGNELPFTLIEPEPGEILYQIDTEAVAHGAVLRIDYSPPLPKPQPPPREDDL